jgi:hypothetical protein
MLEDGVKFDTVRWNGVGSGSVLIVDRRKHDVMTFCTTNVTPFVTPPESASGVYTINLQPIQPTSPT